MDALEDFIEKKGLQSMFYVPNLTSQKYNLTTKQEEEKKKN